MNERGKNESVEGNTRKIESLDPVREDPTEGFLATEQGVRVDDTDNSLKVGPLGEDACLRAVLHRGRLAGIGGYGPRRARIRDEVLRRRGEFRSGRQQHPGLLHSRRDQVPGPHSRRQAGARSGDPAGVLCPRHLLGLRLVDAPRRRTCSSGSSRIAPSRGFRSARRVQADPGGARPGAADWQADADPEHGRLLRRDGAGGVSHGKRGSRDRLHRRSAAGGAELLVPGHAAPPARGAEFHGDPHQSAAGAGAQHESRRLHAAADQGGAGQLHAQLAWRRLPGAGLDAAGRLHAPSRGAPDRGGPRSRPPERTPTSSLQTSAASLQPGADGVDRAAPAPRNRPSGDHAPPGICHS